MGRLNKIKRELIQEANKRLLNESAGIVVRILPCESSYGHGATWFHNPEWGGSDDTGPSGGPVTQADIGKVIVYETGDDPVQNLNFQAGSGVIDHVSGSGTGPNQKDTHFTEATLGQAHCPKKYICKEPMKQATTDVPIREKVDLPSKNSCVEATTGKQYISGSQAPWGNAPSGKTFDSLEDCQRSCKVGGYGPGYDPDAGTAAG